MCKLRTAAAYVAVPVLAGCSLVLVEYVGSYLVHTPGAFVLACLVCPGLLSVFLGLESPLAAYALGFAVNLVYFGLAARCLSRQHSRRGSL